MHGFMAKRLRFSPSQIMHQSGLMSHAQRISACHRYQFSVSSIKSKTEAIHRGQQSTETECKQTEHVQDVTEQEHVHEKEQKQQEEDEATETDDNCLYLSFDDNKHILVMGVFHHDYAAALQVQNAINTLKPDTVFLELCPWRGMKLEKIQHHYSQVFHFSPRDVEGAAIFTASRLPNCNIIYGDVPEANIKEELKKYEEKHYKLLEEQQISMNSFDEIMWSNVYTAVDDKTGKHYMLDANGEQCFLDSRQGIRELMRLNEENGTLTPELKRILYDDRERYMIKAMVEAPKSDKMFAIVGMAHLDGIERLWKSEEFWQDKAFWELKLQRQEKWEKKRWNLLLDRWFDDTFTRVPRYSFGRMIFGRQGGN